MTVVVAPTYRQAKGIAFVRGLDDWIWMATQAVALDWIERCWTRGDFLDPVFIYPITKKVTP